MKALSRSGSVTLKMPTIFLSTCSACRTWGKTLQWDTNTFASLTWSSSSTFHCPTTATEFSRSKKRGCTPTRTSKSLSESPFWIARNETIKLSTRWHFSFAFFLSLTFISMLIHLKIIVQEIDYGRRQRISTNDLLQLPSKFQKLKPQAIEAYLCKFQLFQLILDPSCFHLWKKKNMGRIWVEYKKNMVNRKGIDKNMKKEEYGKNMSRI